MPFRKYEPLYEDTCDFDHIYLIEPRSLLVRRCSLNFCSGALLLGPLYFLIKGDFGFSFLHLFLSIITWGSFWFVFPFFKNKGEAKKLIAMGYNPLDSEEHYKAVRLDLYPEEYGKSLNFSRLGSVDHLYGDKRSDKIL